MIGTKLGPYEIIEAIGAGGMGEVWKARDTRLGRIVAIKKVKEQHSERFKQEARSIAALNHPYICQLFGIGTLQVKLSSESSTQRIHEPTPEAYEAYLKARYLWGKPSPDSLKKYKIYMEEAIALDPDYAQAHCGYADYFLLLTASYSPARELMPVMRKEAEKALEIDPSLPEAHAMLGIVASVLDLDWKEADRCFRSALACDSVPPRVRQWYGYFYLLMTGRIKEAVAQQEQGLKADPLNIVARYCLAYSLFFAGRLADAELEARKILEFEADYGSAAFVLALLFAQQERWTDALYYAEKATITIPSHIGVLGGILKRMGQTERATELMQRLLSGKAYGALLGLFYFYFICGEMDEATKWIKKSIEHRDAAFNVATVHFRSTSRWPEIAKLMNLPEKVS